MASVKRESKKWKHELYYDSTYDVGKTIHCGKCDMDVTKRGARTYGRYGHYSYICAECYRKLLLAENELHSHEPGFAEMHQVQNAVKLRELVENPDGLNQIYLSYCSNITPDELMLIISNVEHGMYLLRNRNSSITDYESYRTRVWSEVARRYKKFLGRYMTINLLERLWQNNHDMWARKFQDRRRWKEHQKVVSKQGERVYPTPAELEKIVTKKLAPSVCHHGKSPEGEYKVQGRVTMKFFAVQGKWHVEVDNYGY